MGREMCPHCGFDLRTEEDMVSGPWRYDPRAGVFLRGERLRVSPGSWRMVGAIMRGGGRVIGYDALVERVDTRGGINVLRQLIAQARREALTYGVQLPVESQFKQGYRWTEEKPVRVSEQPPVVIPQLAYGAPFDDRVQYG